MAANGFVIPLCLVFLCVCCVFAGWGKQEAQGSEPNSLWIGQLFSGMLQWDDFIFNSVTDVSKPRLGTGWVWCTAGKSCSGTMLTQHLQLWIFQPHWVEDALLESLCLSKNHHCPALQPSVPLGMRGFISFYFQAQKCSQFPLLKLRQLCLSKSASELIRNVFCGFWLIQKSSSQAILSGHNTNFLLSYISLHQ